MKLLLTFILILLIPAGLLFAQGQDTTAVADTTAAEEVAEVEEPTDKPVKFSWESGLLINQQTSKIAPAKTLEWAIYHRFGNMENGRKDLWGIYAPGANVRLLLDYVIYKNVQIGAGLTKNNMAADFNAKWTVIEQKTESMPISVTLYGNIGIDGRDKSVWDTMYYNYGNIDEFYEYKFSNRLSYYSEITIGSKLNDMFSVQGGVSFSHYNTVAAGRDHDIIGAHVGGRIKVSPQGSILLTSEIPLHVNDISEGQSTNLSEPNISIGYEVSTGSHSFQMFAGTSNALLPQENMLYNTNKIKGKNFSIGFVITRLWSF